MIQNNPDSPQLESGYTRIANCLLEGILAYPFMGGELRVVFAVIRLTYGWGKKSAVLKVRELALVGGLSQRHAKRLIKQLTRDKILFRTPLNRVRVVIGLNKDFSTWRLRKIRVIKNVPSD